ncbi:hypothetical protein N658DRAFT_475370 [Parathielavia hyrcaniae]|uniref:J domain-containing protein n=1 Tax=Parathielavia hyrcaniae TaxID=113614 RepID=A0AAN6Q1L1_9PEZI|nr:hypothetical protein N658DRAFT_475370 [Parathielavia hyrcaniae]
MVKLDYDRDYYADLELPPTADAVEVKKQFKKLALKWHPDRNPGKEDEAKEKFLVIQAAHEILTDAVTKSKFDAYRQRTSRYPGASGVKGNPWQSTAFEVNQKFGAPPRRPQMPTRPPPPTAASTEHWSWTKGKTKPGNSRANMDAWDRARPQPKPPQPSGAAPGAGPSPSKHREPPTPRTASQARRQEASFGTRRAGYAPASPMGDEPPVRNQHYNTTAHTTEPPKPRPASVYVDPLSEQFSETFLDPRQRTPYAANVGEKTNPFEPLSVNRSKSTRDGARRFQDGVGEAPPPPPRQRSASTGSESPVVNDSGTRPDFQSRASARYSPRGPDTSSAPPTATFPGQSSASSVDSSAHATATVNSDAPDQARNGAKKYESPFSHPHHSCCYSHTPHSSGRAGVGSTHTKNFAFPAYSPQESASPAPSGGRPSPGANSFETILQAQLQHLLGKARAQTHERPVPSPSSNNLPPKKTENWTSRYTNYAYPNSFAVPNDDANSQAYHARFTRNSADNINTRFVAEEGRGTNFQFSAGPAGSTDDGFLRAKQRARDHTSPLRNEFTASAEPSNGAQQAEAAKKQGDFVADQWKEAFGPHIFEPPQPGKPSTSPTRPIRPIKKPRPVRMTAGTAGMVDDDETSGEDKARLKTPASGINGSRSPNAMDIDTPPPEPAAAAGQDSGVRNIPVEPTNPEWRAGTSDANVPTATEPKLGTGLKMPPLKPNAAGSEDAEDFARPIFSEFHNVEPFAQRASGLNSFADLGSSLPFPSRPSAKVPLAREHENSSRPKQLDIPTPPTAPRAPASLCIPGPKAASSQAWVGYVREFEAYLRAWLEFNRRVTDHFAARQKLHEKGEIGAWLNAAGDGSVESYLRALEEDRVVRQRWMAACEAHELHFREFIGVREMVLGV